MESGEIDPPEDAYPAPAVCKQCGKNPPAPCYVICVACQETNKKQMHRPALDGCVRYSDTSMPSTQQRNYLTKGVKQGRDPKVAARDEELHHTEQNTRTQYHGDNYNDE